MNQLDEVPQPHLEPFEPLPLSGVQLLLQLRQQRIQVLLQGAQGRLEFVGDDSREILPEHLLFPAQRNGLLHQSAVVKTAPGNQTQFLGRERFRQKIERPFLHRLDRRTHGGVTGDHDHHHQRELRPNLLQHFQSRQTGHLQIDENEVRRRFLQPGQTCGAIAGGQHLAVTAGQHRRARVKHNLLVVNHQDPRFRRHGVHSPDRWWLRAGG